MSWVTTDTGKGPLRALPDMLRQVSRASRPKVDGTWAATEAVAAETAERSECGRIEEKKKKEEEEEERKQGAVGEARPVTSGFAVQCLLCVRSGTCPCGRSGIHLALDHVVGNVEAHQLAAPVYVVRELTCCSPHEQARPNLVENSKG